MRVFEPAHVVILQKSWQAISGLITAVLVTVFLSQEEQGYYYAIGSLLSGYVLLDLGLSSLLVQVSARLCSGLEVQPGGRIAPEGGRKDDFLAMVAWSKRWYLKAGLIALILLPVGLVYFTFARHEAHGVSWQMPWGTVVLTVAASMSAYPLLAILEGTGRVAEVYLVRLGHYGLGALLAWGLLAGGQGLYAPAMAPLAVGLITFAWVRLRYPALLAESARVSGKFSWQERVWPLQKRVAVSWLASYVFLNSPTLVVFYFRDAVSAGQLGLSIIIANILGSLCASWLIAKVPRITHLVTMDRAGDSRTLFTKEFRKAVLLMVAGYTSAVIVVMSIGNLDIARRILPPVELTMLFLTFLIFHSVSMLSVQFRAHGREVLAMPLMIATLFSLLFSLIFAGDYGVPGVIGSFLIFYCAVCIPGMWLAWKRHVE